jgi:hypothetical protein
MFSTIRYVATATVGGVVAIGLLSGCVNVDSPSGTPTVNVSMPTIPSIPIDPSKPLEVHAEEWKGAFAKIYCPLRNTPIADAVADEGKRLWNVFAAEAQRQGAPVPGFDLSDPKMCQ